jgi:hypothetical protein
MEGALQPKKDANTELLSLEVVWTSLLFLVDVSRRAVCMSENGCPCGTSVLGVSG